MLRLGLLIIMGSASAWQYPVPYTKLYKVGHTVMTPKATARWVLAWCGSRHKPHETKHCFRLLL